MMLCADSIVACVGTLFLRWSSHFSLGPKYPYSFVQVIERAEPDDLVAVVNAEGAAMTLWFAKDVDVEIEALLAKAEPPPPLAENSLVGLPLSNDAIASSPSEGFSDGGESPIVSSTVVCCRSVVGGVRQK